MIKWDFDRAVELWKQGYNWVEIARELGMKDNGFYKIRSALIKRGIVANKQGAKYKMRMLAIKHNELLKLVERKVPLGPMSDQLKVSEASLRTYLREHNIQRIKISSGGSPSKRHLVIDNKEKIMGLLNEGRSLEAIARELPVSAPTLKKHLGELGDEVPRSIFSSKTNT